MSIITFNKSTSDREDFLVNKSPYQIVPLHDRFFYKEYLDTLPNPEFDNKILIHSSFTTRPFSNKQIGNKRCNDNLKGYELIANKLRTKYILFHGPANIDDYHNFNNGLSNIDLNIKDKIICIEIPAFSKAFIDYINKQDQITNSPSNPSNNSDNQQINQSSNQPLNTYYNFICEYLNTVTSFKPVNNQFQIVLDTAHLHSNGLNGIEIIKLCNEYLSYYDFIHMNGNIKDQFKPDIHTPIDSVNDKIKFSEYVVRNIAKLNKICICETKDGDYEYYQELSEEYGYSIVDKNKLYAY